MAAAPEIMTHSEGEPQVAHTLLLLHKQVGVAHPCFRGEQGVSDTSIEPPACPQAIAAIQCHGHRQTMVSDRVNVTVHVLGTIRQGAGCTIGKSAVGKRQGEVFTFL